MTLQELINMAMADGSASAQEGQDVLSRALMLGASVDDISQMSGLPTDEINNFITANNLQGTLPQDGSANDLFNPTVNIGNGQNSGDLNTVGGQNPGSLSNPPIANTPQNPNPPVPTPGQPAQTPGMGFQLPGLENLGNTFADLFGNNPGALGFSDLNPTVTGAESTTQAAIPEALKPFLAQSIDASQGAMGGLTQLLARDNALTSPFNSLQNQGQQMALDVAGGAGGFIPNAQAAISEIADSSDIVGLFDRAQRLLEAPEGLGGLNNLAQGTGGNQAAMNTLQSTAQGDFLYGNPAFDEAVQASIRAATPGLVNTFSSGGQGAISGGLADVGRQQVASDAFARQFGNERNRMLGASNSLNSQDLASRGVQMNALNSIVGAQQNAGGVFSDMANNDRSRQFAAAQILPQFGLLGSDIVSQVGGQFQGQEERTKAGQVQAMQGLLQSAFGNVNPNSLFGNINSVQNSSNSALGALGGAQAGAQIGSMFGPIGTGIGAIGGGLLGGGAF